MADRKAEYGFYKSIGICVRCHKRKAESNKVMCMECADKEKEYASQKRERNIDRLKKRDIDKYNELKRKGICVRCKRRPATPGHVDCPYCRGRQRRKRELDRQDISRSERTSYGLCYICGEPVAEGKKVCEPCYKKRLASMQICLESRKAGFNDYWKGQNSLIFQSRKGNLNGATH